MKESSVVGMERNTFCSFIFLFMIPYTIVSTRIINHPISREHVSRVGRRQFRQLNALLAQPPT